MEDKISKSKQEQTADSKNHEKLIIKSLDDNKLIGLLLISLINETSQLNKDLEIILKKKEIFLLQKKNCNSKDQNEDLKFDCVKENSKRLAILENYDKIENILDDNYVIHNKVLESIFVLLLKIVNNILFTLDIKRLIKCVSRILKKQIEIFDSLDKLRVLYEIFISKKIIENLINNYLIILDSTNFNKYTNINNNNNEILEINVLDRELIDEIFSSLIFFYFPMKDSFKISVMPGVISKLVKFFLKNNKNSLYIKNNIDNNKENSQKKFLLSKKVIFTTLKLLNHNLALLISLEKTEDFNKNFPNFFEAFNIFFNELCRLIIDVNHKANLFSSIDLEIKLKKTLENKDGLNFNFDLDNRKQKAEIIKLNFKSFLEEINYTGYLIVRMFIKINHDNNNNNNNKKESKDITENIYEEIFHKINLINQRYLFQYSFKSKENIDEINTQYNENLGTVFDSYNNFAEIFTYDILINNLNNDLKTLNVILNLQETHKVNLLLLRVNGTIELYKSKYKKDFFAKNLNIDIESIKTNIINISWKFMEDLIDKFFIIKNIKFLEYH